MKDNENVDNKAAGLPSRPLICSTAVLPPHCRPIKYYRCPDCNGEFVQPPEGYQGLCRKCLKVAETK